MRTTAYIIVFEPHSPLPTTPTTPHFRNIGPPGVAFQDGDKRSERHHGRQGPEVATADLVSQMS